MKIGIITTTIRNDRVGLDVAKWVYNLAKDRKDAQYELVDLKEYNLPIFGLDINEDEIHLVNKWKEKIASLDGYIFVVAEYNHSFSGVFKNALDFLKEEFTNKAAALIGYGGLGASRAIEHLRLVLSEMQVATTQRNVNFLLAVDFINYSQFSPQNYQLASLEELFKQIELWTKGLKEIRMENKKWNH